MADSTFNNIGIRVAELRRAHGDTQEKLAEKLGVSPKHVGHVEVALSSFSLKYMIMFCEIYGCSMDYLVFGEERNSTLKKLPENIITILNSGDSDKLDRLNRYLEEFT